MTDIKNPTATMLENELNHAREAFAGRRNAEVQSGKVKSVRFYHNSKTRHNGATFILEDGKEVFKELRETDFLNIAHLFTAVHDVTVWYDKDGMVQQFVLNHNY